MFTIRCHARTFAVVSAVFVCATLTACGDSGTDRTRDPIREAGDGAEPDEDGGAPADADAEALPSCAGESDGHACAPDRHCIDEQCVYNTCGDGVKAGDEECDDGNEVLGDECSPGCKPTPKTCGDGEVGADEECDDGNLINDDACANDCTVHECGNGRVDVGEECDDGNSADGDACSSTCGRSLCRDGKLDPGEECDDGNTDHYDGCTNDCKLVTCGDGVAEEQEECDDGNKVDADTCSNACTANECANGRIDPGEACDTSMGADGQPIPDGARCNADCSGLETNEACRECEYQEHCTNYMGSEVDLPRFCYDEVPPEGAVISEFNEKCTALIRCISRNRCDLTGAIEDPIFCYCGKDTTFDECAAGMNIVGPCIAEYEAATDAAPGDYAHVLNNANDLANPAGRAFYLAQCQRENCLDACR